MAAKPLTTEEINYLRSWYLTSIIGTDAVKAYFDRVHPPADLETHLANDKVALESLKPNGIISNVMWEKIYPSSGASPVTSAEYDITILICLLREMAPKVPAPRHGFEKLPQKNDTSAGACLAIIKRYRNFLGHPDQVKMRTLSSTTFNDLFARVGKAIQILGNNQFSSEITAAKKLNIDNDIAQILEKVVSDEKQFQGLEEGVNKNSSQTMHQQKEIKELWEKYEEIEINQTEEKISQQQVIDQMSKIRINVKLQKEALEKKVKEQKQLAATQTKHGKQIQTLEQETGLMKKKQEDQRKDMKEWTEKHYAITSRTEQLEKKANESKEIQTMQHESIQTIGQEQEEQRKEVKELKEKQQSMPRGRNVFEDLDQLKDVVDKLQKPEITFQIENTDLKKEIHQMSRCSFSRDIFVPDEKFYSELEVYKKDKIGKALTATEKKKMATYAKNQYSSQWRPKLKKELMQSKCESAIQLSRQLFKGYVDTATDRKRDRIYRLQITAHMIKVRESGEFSWDSVKSSYYSMSTKPIQYQNDFYSQYQ